MRQCPKDKFLKGLKQDEALLQSFADKQQKEIDRLTAELAEARKKPEQGEFTKDHWSWFKGFQRKDYWMRRFTECLEEIDRLTTENKELKVELEWWGNLTRDNKIGTKDVPSLHDYIVQLQSEINRLITGKRDLFADDARVWKEEIDRLTAELEEYRQANIKCAQAIFGLEDTIDRLTGEIEEFKKDHHKHDVFTEWANSYLDSGRWAGYDIEVAIKTVILEKDAELKAKDEIIAKINNHPLGKNILIKVLRGVKDGEETNRPG